MELPLGQRQLDLTAAAFSEPLPLSVGCFTTALNWDPFGCVPLEDCVLGDLGLVRRSGFVFCFGMLGMPFHRKLLYVRLVYLIKYVI